MKNLCELHSIEEWTACQPQIAASTCGTLLLKFSPYCPISRGVESAFKAWYAQLPAETEILCIKVDVVNSKPLSQHIAQELNIRHESPQAIWLDRDQRVVWHDSHYAITREALDTQLQTFNMKCA
jgi:bacillithiol system protein YtxJ